MSATSATRTLAEAARALALRALDYVADPSRPGKRPNPALDCDVEVYNLANEVLVALGEGTKQ